MRYYNFFTIFHKATLHSGQGGIHQLVRQMTTLSRFFKHSTSLYHGEWDRRQVIFAGGLTGFLGHKALVEDQLWHYCKPGNFRGNFHFTDFVGSTIRKINLRKISSNIWLHWRTASDPQNEDFHKSEKNSCSKYFLGYSIVTLTSGAAHRWRTMSDKYKILIRHFINNRNILLQILKSEASEQDIFYLFLDRTKYKA